MVPMNVLVTQPANEYASQRVILFVDGKEMGGVGVGESLLLHSDHSPCVISAICGFSRASISLKADAELQICWALNTPMELVAAKSK